MRHLIALWSREPGTSLRAVMAMNIVTAISTAVFLATVNMGAEAAAAGDDIGGLVVVFVINMIIFALTQNYTLLTSSQDIEWLIHRMRLELFDEIRRSDQPTLEQAGRAELYAALTQDTQTLARVLPMVAVAFQQALMLVFIGVYMAWLSPVAFALCFGFSALAVAIRFQRMQKLGEAMRASMVEEAKVFDGLTDMLRGFKEVRMNRTLSDGLMGDLSQVSARARLANTEAKSQWGKEFAIIQALFYLLVGVMVFVVPLFTTGYYTIVAQVTTMALFIVGPVGTLAQVSPMVAEANAALSHIHGLRQKLRHFATEAPDEFARPLAGPVREIALAHVTYAYPGDKGDTGFAVGPISARFRAGEITFITGGNGSGKSTMLRLLTGLMPVEGGALLADGALVDREQLQGYRDQISAVFSDLHLSRRLYGIEEPEPGRVRALLQRLEMASKVAVKDGAFSTVALSTGQRKRLALMVTELEARPVLVLDEWAADQDPHYRKIFYEELLPEFRDRGRIVICVTHDDHYFHIADNVMHMAEGRLTVVRGHDLVPDYSPFALELPS